ncbi:MAG: hypothetical protein HOP37_01775 [Cyclobacteriaceae bacterium]|nr:hypothetical protein [Cyclobacteriaceae bacterium]
MKSDKRTKEAFYFNGTQTHAIMAGLNLVYKEALIWADGSQLRVWVVGDNHDFLFQAFRHLKTNAKQWRLEAGQNAVEYFTKIIFDDRSTNSRLPDKLQGLIDAQQIAIEADSLGPQLTELIEKGLEALRAQPVIAGFKNSFRVASKENDTIQEKVVHTNCPERFYRFSVN